MLYCVDATGVVYGGYGTPLVGRYTEIGFNMRIIRITDYEDPRIDVYTRLTDHQLRRHAASVGGVMIAESRFVIETALELGLLPHSMLLDERHVDSMMPLLEKLPPKTPVYVASREVMSQVVGFKVTRGYLCALPRPITKMPKDVLEGARRIAVLEGLVDVTNMGAIFRSAAALGIDAVLLAPDCADPYSRRALRVSMGCVLKVPWARAVELKGGWPHMTSELLHEQGFHCCALALRDDAVPLDDPTLKEHEKLALFLGTEGWGLTQPALDACDASVIIPMANSVDSLNVAAAAAVAFWELRKR